MLLEFWKIQCWILRNLNMDLEYTSTIITMCCILHNFLIEKGDIDKNKEDKESNSKAF